MRGNLIVSKYGGPLYRIILDESGTGVVASSKPAILLGGAGGLGVTQAPNGVLIEASFKNASLFFHEPKEPASTVLVVKSVFPHRGGGGSTLSIYGEEFSGGSPSVTVGGANCGGATIVNSKKITCTLPNLPNGTKDINVSVGGNSATFFKGYRYI